MPQTKFHSTTARGLIPGAKALLHYATNFAPGYPGTLGMRISPGGTKTWFIQYRLPGKSTAMKFSIGQYPAMAFKSAKQKATDLLKNISEGGDPKQEKQEALKAVTMAELFDIYIKHHAIPNKKEYSVKCDRDNFRLHVAPVLGQVKAETIKRRDVISLLDGISETSPVMRNRVQSLLSMVFNVGVDRDLVEHNPVFRMKKVKETSRDRVLDTDEIVALWREWQAVRMGTLFMLKLLTAQRDQEIKTMRWDDIKDGIWTIPKEHTKNSKTHSVPLSRQAEKLLETIPKRGEHVFFSARCKAGHVTSTKKCFRECRDAAKLPSDTRGHDLRRTAATFMGDMGVSDNDIGAVLNHSDGSVTGIYNRSEQIHQKSRALQKWADKLDKILGIGAPAKIIELRKQA